MTSSSDYNPVLFGVTDAQVQTIPTQYDNILCGRPLWITNPSKESQLCDICGKPMVFLMQIYCPFPGSVANRKLFILFCREHCDELEGGWKIIRQVEPELDLKLKDISTTDWNNDDDDDWGDDDDDDWGVSDKVKDMNISDHKETSKTSTEFLTVAEIEEKSFYINVVEDYKEDLSYENELLKKYESKEMEISSGGGDRKEVSNGIGEESEDDDEEETIEEKCISEFIDCCRRIPNQILRYQIQGRPLSLEPNQYSQGKLIPQCSICGAQRIFELQLMPHLSKIIPILKSFGTIQIFTCSANCGKSSSSIVEYYILQREPDASRFK